MLLVPLVGAIAAGNTVVLRPSPLAPRIAHLLEILFQKYMDMSAYKIIQGNEEQMNVLLEQKFDYIFYSGSKSTAKTVAGAAAAHLTPITMQLGGKR